MNEKAPLVSVLMSVYNGQQYLAEAIESILNQSFSDFEFIILDDASSDSSWDILQNYAACDVRIKLVQNELNLGLTRSLNKGLQIARGKYLARQDADDIALPDRLKKQVEWIENHPEAVLVSCNLEVIDANGRAVMNFLRSCDPLFIDWYLLFYNRLAGHSQVLFNLRAVKGIGGYSEDCRYSQDYELWLRLVSTGDMIILPEILQQWRQHSQSISGSFSAEQERYQLLISQKNLGRLTGQELDLALVADLKGFWSGRFSEDRSLSELDSWLRRIYSSFLIARKTRYFQDARQARRVKTLIGKQFLFGAQIQAFKQDPFLKLKLSLYAFRWHPVGALLFWGSYPWSALQRKPAFNLTNKTLIR